jgi:hypothetical protein
MSIDLSMVSKTVVVLNPRKALLKYDIASLSSRIILAYTSIVTGIL